MNAILSIKPKFVNEIFAGRKKYEYRKKGFGKRIDKIYIYASSPICKIVGEFVLNDILVDTPESIWEKTKDVSGITEEFFFDYYNERSVSYALEIGEIKEYKTQINPHELLDTFTAPQSFIYIERDLLNR